MSRRFVPFALADITHAYPEWKRHEAALNSRDTTRVPMNYDDLLDPAPPDADPCFPLNEAEAQERREILADLAAFENRWN